MRIWYEPPRRYLTLQHVPHVATVHAVVRARRQLTVLNTNLVPSRWSCIGPERLAGRSPIRCGLYFVSSGAANELALRLRAAHGRAICSCSGRISLHPRR